MTNRNETTNDISSEFGVQPAQRSPRTDPDLRDGDSGRGNPLESGPGQLTTDNNVGDTHPAAAGDIRSEVPPPLPPGAQIDRAREAQQLLTVLPTDSPVRGALDTFAEIVATRTA